MHSWGRRIRVRELVWSSELFPVFMTGTDQHTNMAEASRDAADDTLATAIGQYVLGEVSLGKAAENAGMTRWEFEELLEDAGFDALYGPRSAEELRDEVDAALDLE